MVDVTVSIPEELAAILGGPAQKLARRFLEDSVAEAYRLNRLSRADVARFLKHGSWHETEQFLVARQIELSVDKSELEHDIAVMDRFLKSK